MVGSHYGRVNHYLLVNIADLGRIARGKWDEGKKVCVVLLG